MLVVFVSADVDLPDAGLGRVRESTGITKTGGYVGLLTALAAWYASFAGVTAFTWAARSPRWVRDE